MVALILAIVVVNPAPRTIEFSGRTWVVKQAMEQKVGPGPNLFSDSADSVFVDGRGRLHLKVVKTPKGWASSEVYIEQPLGYGTYTFELDSPAKAVDDNLVLGLFTYGESEDYAHREIDVEIARWADPAAFNTQFVVQPYETKGNMLRFELPQSAPSSKHTFTWRKDRIDYRSVAGKFEKKWRYEGADIPVPGDETVHLNFWMFEGKAPKSGKTCEVIIRRFQFQK